MLRVTNTLAAPGQLARSLATSSRVQIHTSPVRLAAAAQADRKPRSTTGRNAPGEKAKKGREKLARPRKEGRAPRGEDGSALYPLSPNDLARRLKQICDEGHYDEAVSVLKSAPVGAQNTPVWNTVIWVCLKSGKYKLAFKLFTDMKRRGFQPSIRTYSSMLSGYARITGPKWSTLAVQLENVQTIYGQFVTLIDQLKRSGKIDSTLYEHISAARAGYIAVLGENGQHQRMFDAYNAMETQGSLAPDRVVFTAMFKALMARKTLTSAVKPDEHDYENGMLPQAGSARSQNAADARLLWRQMLKIFETNTEAKLGERYSIDTFLIREFIGVLALGRPSDQNFALDIVQEHLHLSIPSESGGSSSKPLASKPPLLTTHTMDATLDLVNEMNRYRLTVQLFQQVVDLEDALTRAASRKHGADVHTEPSILDRGLADRVLFAYSCLPGEADQALELVRWMLRRVALGEHRMRPEFSTFEHVLIASWRSQNWDSATAAWELMTGYRMKSFADGRPASAATQERASRGKLALEPGPQHASALARTALAKRTPESARVCLRMLEAVNVRDMIPSSSFGNVEADGDINGSKSVRRHLFYGHKLAEALVPLINNAVGDTPPVQRSEEQKRWLGILALAKKGRNGSTQATGSDDSTPGARREGRRITKPLKPRDSFDSKV